MRFVILFLIAFGSTVFAQVPGNLPTVQLSNARFFPKFSLQGDDGWAVVKGTLRASHRWQDNKIEVKAVTSGYRTGKTFSKVVPLVRNSQREFAIPVYVDDRVYRVELRFHSESHEHQQISEVLNVNRDYSGKALNVWYVAPEEDKPYFSYLQEIALDFQDKTKQAASAFSSKGNNPKVATPQKVQLSPQQLQLLAQRRQGKHWHYFSDIQRLEISRVAPEQLPQIWYEYDHVDVVILNSKAPIKAFEQKHSARGEALLKWVAMGGTVIVSPASSLWLQNSQFLKKLFQLPQLATSFTFFTSASAEWQKKIPSLKEQNVLNFAHPNRKEIFSQKTCWWLAHGWGTVMYVGLDLGKLGKDASSLWVDELFYYIPQQTPAKQARYTHTHSSSYMMHALRDLHEQMPGFWPITLFILVYILVIGPLNFFVAKKRGKSMLLFFSIPLMAVVAAVLVLGYGFLSKGKQSRVVGLTMEFWMPGSEYTYQKSFFNLFSGSRGFCEISAQPDEYITTVESRRLRTNISDYVWQPSLTLVNFPLNLWQTQTFTSDRIKKTGLCRVVADQNYQLTIDNGSDYQLTKLISFRKDGPVGGILANPCKVYTFAGKVEPGAKVSLGYEDFHSVSRFYDIQNIVQNHWKWQQQPQERQTRARYNKNELVHALFYYLDLRHQDLYEKQNRHFIVALAQPRDFSKQVSTEAVLSHAYKVVVIQMESKP